MWTLIPGLSNSPQVHGLVMLPRAWEAWSIRADVCTFHPEVEDCKDLG